jgi:hypothetical protein
MKTRLFLLSAIVLASQSVAAGSESLALRFVEILRYGVQFEEAHAQCLRTNSSIPPEKILNISPENPGPVPPGSALWPRVLAAYDEYWKDMCAHPTREEYLSVVARSYAQNLTDQELDASIQFYTSPAGGSLVAANTVAVRDLFAEYQRFAAQNIQPAVVKLNKALERIGEAAAIEKCRERASLKSAASGGCPASKSPNG